MIIHYSSCSPKINGPRVAHTIQLKVSPRLSRSAQATVAEAITSRRRIAGIWVPLSFFAVRRWGIIVGQNGERTVSEA